MRSLFLTACTVTSLAWSANAASLLENGSFEQPVVTSRTSATAGGSPALGQEPTGFTSLTTDGATEGGTLQVGLTNEIARTGKQSIYVNFERVSASGRKAVLKTKAIPVKPSQAYRLSMWGRIDRTRPLALDESRPQMWIEIRFYKEDQTTETGEAVAGVQSIPGEVLPGGPNDLHFLTEKWKESAASAVTPADAKFVKVTWYWLTTEDEGATDGIIYFDDALLEETAVPPPPAAPSPEATEPTSTEASPGEE